MEASEPAVARAALMLVDEHRRAVQFRPFSAEFGIADATAAYAVQDEFVRLQKETRRVVARGYKIGLTSARMQAMCGIDSPIAGVVLEDRLAESGARLARADYGRLGVEFEVAVKMKSDLGGGALTIADVAKAVDQVAAAIEIIDDRRADYRSLDVLSVIADNGWNSGIVLGAFQSAWPELSEIEGVVSLDGRTTDRGWGRDVLDHPFHAVAWLADHLARSGSALRAGDIVMTGSIVTTKFPETPCRYRFELSGLGSVDVSVA